MFWHVFLLCKNRDKTQNKYNMKVKAWREKVTIPTYGIGKPEKNPIFLEKRVYQGSSGVVYPHPVIEKIYDKKEDKEWNAVYLENQYLKIMILPELGGRVQMAYDKTKQRHFVYYNNVIKPALVGLTGPWISGGIEFNWPQHHRPSTYQPVDSYIEENSDGSTTVWCSEVERMFRTKGMTGFTLSPDKAFMEIKVKLYNRTPNPQTFLWWANPAVKVNDNYQSVFPPDVNAVFDHGKRDVSEFPIAKGVYYKKDYSPGTDISRYKNIPVPTSFMAITSKYDFVGGYEHDTKGGLLHVADHHVSPGKKQWTWGTSDFGQAWDRNLTDNDGPYIELMCGVFTDNQPDFSWLQPYEEKSFSQYFMPYRDLGLVKNATKEALINVEFEKNSVTIKTYTTSAYNDAIIKVEVDGQTIFSEKVNFSPKMSYKKDLDLAGINRDDIKVSLTDNSGNILVAYSPEPNNESTVPDPAMPASAPEEISSTEQLYLRGLHLEQYRHATYSATDYYQEALNREPGNVQCNNAMGLWLMRKGQIAKAEPYFRKAIETLTERNPNPYDGEPLFNLGLCLQLQGELDEAYDSFYKATWNSAWQDSGFFHAAQIAATRREYNNALELINKSLNRNNLNQKARHLKVTLLRKTGQHKTALKNIEESLHLDKFNYGLLYEKYLLLNSKNVLSEMKALMRGYVHNYIEFSLDYAAAGFYHEAESFILEAVTNPAEAYPMVYYLAGSYANSSGVSEGAISYFTKASQMSPDYCFPNRIEELLALQTATELYPADAKAYYYLGNYWYSNRQYTEAVNVWERSVEIDDSFPTAHRNLALAYFNKLNNPAKAKYSLEKAFLLDKSDARVFMELDQLYKKLNQSLEFRLDNLEKYSELVNFRDDLYLEKLTLLNLKGEEESALKLLMNRQFHPWEGGEGKVTGQYLYSNVELAKKAITEGRYNDALKYLDATAKYPHNLGEGKLDGALENDIHYWRGCAYEGLNNKQKAEKEWQKASENSMKPAISMYYNDQHPDKIFYEGLALIKLNRKAEAEQKFSSLVVFGEKQLKTAFKMDYFAVSLPDLLIFEEDMQKRHETECHYLIGLGHLGLGNSNMAMEELNKVLKANRFHQGANVHLGMIDNEIK